MHAQPGYTTAETLTSPYTLLVFQAADGYAFGHTYLDDGESLPPTPHTNVQFFVEDGSIKVKSSGSFDVRPKLESITVLGTAKPSAVMVQGRREKNWSYVDGLQKLEIRGLNVDLNAPTTIEWK